MNWEAVGAFAELSGAVGVIVSLVFLARQIQKNTRAVRATTNHALNQLRTEMNIRFALDSGATDLLVRGARNHAELQPLERARHTLLMRAIIGAYENTYVQFREGTCDPETWDMDKYALGNMAREPGFAPWWQRNRDGFISGFRSEIDSLIRAA